MALAALTASGCGIKGPLTLPEKSENVVIRAPGAATTGSDAAAAPSAETSAAPATTQEPAKPKRERLPPPPLPSRNPGTGNGG
jgi:predicted small lipoprotein YifL